MVGERGPYPPTPELNRMASAREDLGTQDIHNFLEWLQGQGIVLAKWVGTETPSELVRIMESYDDLLFRYAEIDSRKIDQEKRAILAWHRGTTDE